MVTAAAAAQVPTIEQVQQPLDAVRPGGEQVAAMAGCLPGPGCSETNRTNQEQKIATLPSYFRSEDEPAA
jgi:hypothetical protein